MANKLDLILKDIKDERVRDNFRRLKKFIEQQQIVEPDWQFYEVEVANTGSNRIRHNLKFKPQDIIILSAEGDRNFYFEHEKFNKTSLYVYTESTVRIRFLAGSYGEKGFTKSLTNLVATAPPSSGGGGSGTTWLNGSGTPGGGTGSDGNYYLDLNNGDVYLKAGGAWTLYTVHPTTTTATEFVISRVAGEDIDAGEYVYASATPGEVLLGQFDETKNKANCLGLAITTVLSGASVSVLISGVADYPSFSVFTTPGDPLFLDSDGGITDTKQISGYHANVGKYLGGTEIFVDINPPTKLA